MRNDQKFNATYGSNGALRVPVHIGACDASVSYSDSSVTIVLTRNHARLSRTVNVTGVWQKDLFPKGTTGHVSRQKGDAYRSVVLVFSKMPNGQYATTIARNLDHYREYRTELSRIKDNKRGVIL